MTSRLTRSPNSSSSTASGSTAWRRARPCHSAVMAVAIRLVVNGSAVLRPTVSSRADHTASGASSRARYRWQSTSPTVERSPRAVPNGWRCRAHKAISLRNSARVAESERASDHRSFMADRSSWVSATSSSAARSSGSASGMGGSSSSSDSARASANSEALAKWWKNDPVVTPAAVATCRGGRSGERTGQRQAVDHLPARIDEAGGAYRMRRRRGDVPVRHPSPYRSSHYGES